MAPKVRHAAGPEHRLHLRAIGEHLGPVRIASPRRRDPHPVAGRPLPGRRRIDPLQLRHADNTRDHPTPFGDRQRMPPGMPPVDEGAGTVDRIDNEDPLRPEPLGPVDAFLREPAVIGPRARQQRPQHCIDLEIGLGHRPLPARLVPRLPAAGEMAQGDPAGLPRRSLQQREISFRQ